MTVAALWARADWRRRSKALASLGLVLGLAGAVVLTVAAGAQRASTSYDRLVDRTDRFDVQVLDDTPDAQLISRIPELPGVVASDKALVTFGAASHGGARIEELIVVSGSGDSWYRDFDRPLLDTGRMADPARPNEVVLNNHAAEQLGATVGDVVAVTTVSPDQFPGPAFGSAAPTAPAGGSFQFDVVGVGRLADDVDAPDPAMVVSSSIFDQGDIGRFDRMVVVRLAEGQAGVDEFVAAVERLPGFDPTQVFFTPAEESDERVIDGLALQRGGLQLFALIGYVVVAVTSLQAVSRQVASGSEGQRVLADLGVSRAVRIVSLALPFLAVAGIAATVAIGGSIAASPLLPTGFARAIEPDPGVYVDLAVLLPGGLLVGATVVVAALVSSRSATRNPGPTAPLEPSRIASAAAELGVGVVGVTGLRMAFDGRSTRTRIAVRSTIAGLTLGITGVVASLGFGASLGHLLSTDALYGWTWDVRVDVPAEGAASNDLAERLANLGGVDGIVVADTRDVSLDDRPVIGVGLDPIVGYVGLAYVAGRPPSGPDEVALGPELLRDLGLSIGDDTTARGADGEPRSLRVVGSALLPLDEDDQRHAAMALLTMSGLEGLAPDEGFRHLLVRLSGPVGDLRGLPDGSMLEPAPPTAIANLRQTRHIPVALAVFMACLALVVLVHALLVGVRRRSLDLAVLRAIGLTPRQLSGAIVVQSLALAAVGVVLGLAVGVALGRAVWSEFAARLDVVVEVREPWPTVGTVVVGFLVLSGLIALVRPRLGRSVQSVDVLSAE